MTGIRRISPFAAAAAPGTTFLAWLQWRTSSNPWGARRFTLFDDAMISMDFARTLARHGEFTWFRGAPRVQGFTNPLWTIWMAAVHLIGLDGSSAALAVSVTSIVLVVLTARVVFALVNEVCADGGTVGPSIAAGSVFLLYPTVFWSLRGMEVGAVAFFGVLLLAGAVSWAGTPTRPTSAPVVTAIVLGTATRFDFMALSIVAVLLLCTWAPPSLRARVFAVNSSVMVASSGTVLLLQKAYWGSWLPNTYTLKMSGVALPERVARGLAASGKFAPVVVLVMVALWAGRLLPPSGLRTLHGASAMIATMAAYSVYIGGDAWESLMLNRFHATVLPLVVVVVAVGIGGGRARKMGACLLASILVPCAGLLIGVTVNPFGWGVPRWAVLEAVLIVGGLASIVAVKMFGGAAVVPSCLFLFLASVSLLPLAREVRSGNYLTSRTNLYVTETVETLDRLVDDSAVIATVWAGVPAYYTSNPMIDLLGKNDEGIARSSPHGVFYPGHNKWDYAHSVGKGQPDVVFQTFTRGLEPDLPERMRSWGYGKFCTGTGTFPVDGVWFRKSSTHVHWDELTSCPTG